MRINRFIQAYIFPPAIFQAVGIGGGYGTGRELVEYFTKYGAWGGVYGIIVATIFLAVIIALSFEFCRLFRVYDYRLFFKALIGRYWVVFELLYFVIFIIVLAVVASAAGAILHNQFGIQQQVGTFMMILLTAVLVFFGREWILKTLTIWAVVMSLVFITYFINILPAFSEKIQIAFEVEELGEGWYLGGLNYALICSVILPALLFVTRGFETRKEALLSGTITAVYFMLPALLFHIIFAGWMPQISSIQVPTYWTIIQANMPILLSAYVIAIFGTFVQTGAGFIQGLNERIDSWWLETHNDSVPRAVHLSIALIALLSATAISYFGIITLIAIGYVWAGWALSVVFILPLFTIGVRRIFFGRQNI